MKKISPTRRAALLLGRNFDKLETENKKLKKWLAAISDTTILVTGTARGIGVPNCSSDEIPVCAISMEDVVERIKISEMVVLSTSNNDDYLKVPRGGGHIATTFKAAK